MPATAPRVPRDEADLADLLAASIAATGDARAEAPLRGGPSAPIRAATIPGDLLGRADRFAVLDVETSGVGADAEVVEIAVVTVDAAGRVVDEWDSLVAPRGGVGPTELHGVTHAMVGAAPRFAAVAGVLAARLHGAVLVAHNAAFDLRVLAGEFERRGATLREGDSVCTFTQLGSGLSRACAQVGVEPPSAHRALADARAVARLLPHAVATLRPRPHAPARVLSREPLGMRPRTLRRDAVCGGREAMPFAASQAPGVRLGAAATPDAVYLEAIDRALGDLELDAGEVATLVGLAAELGLDLGAVRELVAAYRDDARAAACRDGVVTPDERRLLDAIAVALGVGW